MITTIFITVIYQPFLNILVGFYWLLSFVSDGKPDMGIAVIFLTILIRLILLPISLSGSRSEEERREIAKKVREVEEIYATEPIKIEKEKRKIIKRSKRVLVGEIFNLFIQVTIALMLWKIFKTGLPGKDIDLIYPFMPKQDLPFNLVFLGKYDLSNTSFTLNFIQSLLIFILETVSIYTSPYKVSRNDVVRMQLILPVVSFMVFIAMPAGKKLFVITSLIISIIITIFKAVKRKYASYKYDKIEKNKSKEEEKDKIVVAVK